MTINRCILIHLPNGTCYKVVPLENPELIEAEAHALSQQLLNGGRDGCFGRWLKVSSIYSTSDNIEEILLFLTDEVMRKSFITLHTIKTKD